MLLGIEAEQPVARAVVPLAGSIAGSGPALVISASQNNAFRAINAAWSAGAHVRMDSGGGGHFVVTGLPAGSVAGSIAAGAGR